MKIAKRISFVIMIVSGATTLLGLILIWLICRFSLNGNGAASVGIIGGADGATAIFIATEAAPPLALAPIAFVISLMAWLALRYMTKKRKADR